MTSRSSQKDVVDPATGLTANDRDNIFETWSLYRQNVRKNAVLLFESLFSRYPEYQKMFKSFTEVQPRDLRKSHVAVAHSLAVAYFMSAMVDNLEDSETLIDMIRKNARNHLCRPVTPEHFIEFGNVLIDVLHERMRLRMTPSVATSWKRFFVLQERIARQVYKESSAAPPKDSADP